MFQYNKELSVQKDREVAMKYYYGFQKRIWDAHEIVEKGECDAYRFTLGKLVFIVEINAVQIFDSKNHMARLVYIELS